LLCCLPCLALLALLVELSLLALTSLPCLAGLHCSALPCLHRLFKLHHTLLECRSLGLEGGSPLLGLAELVLQPRDLCVVLSLEDLELLLCRAVHAFPFPVFSRDLLLCLLLRSKLTRLRLILLSLEGKGLLLLGLLCGLAWLLLPLLTGLRWLWRRGTAAFSALSAHGSRVRLARGRSLAGRLLRYSQSVFNGIDLLLCLFHYVVQAGHTFSF